LASAAVSESDQVAPEAISQAIEKVASVLARLRHTDGGLAADFHAASRPVNWSPSDQALAMLGVRPAPAEKSREWVMRD